MRAPEFVVGHVDRDTNGALRGADLARIGDVLLRGGFVLLPSDTSYSIAVLPLNHHTRQELNLLLTRPDQPLSIAFSNLAAAARWAAPNPVAIALLKRFCPGPITVVTRASLSVPVQVIDRALGGKNSMIGIRIPNSAVERSVASALCYPVTTTAVIDSGPVTDSVTACRFVQERIAATTFPSWCAVEGTVDYTDLSTVVRVNTDGRLDQIRAGAIPLSDIESERSLILQEQQ